jgi:uncharacterized membrane protein
MARQTLISFLLALTLLGLLDAAYLAETAMTGKELACDINGLEGCNAVAQSPYSHLFGLPLGVYGVAFYGLFLILAGLALARPARALERALALLSAIGVVASAYFLYVQLALIKAVCLYCLASALIAVLLALVAWLLVRSPRIGDSPSLPSSS